jgi:hypothetical protein
LEETRHLSPLEIFLRFLSKQHLSQKNSYIATYWRQWAKIKNSILGDENSRYFHLCASGRLRKNQIKNLEGADGDVFSPTPRKPTSSMISLRIFSAPPPTGSGQIDFFPLVALTSLDSTQADTLVRPFTLEEIRKALFSMNNNPSPGPGGFGPVFFKRNWDLVKDNLLEALNNFF